ncbi:MAG: hypothetical protein ACFE0O_13445 [Opitutales bacterium]
MNRSPTIPGLLAVVLVCLAGCRSSGGTVPRVYLEARSAVQGERTRTFTLPRSQAAFEVWARPVLTEFAFANAEMVRVDRGLCLLLETDPAGARQLYRITTANLGAVLVLTINDNPVGVRQIDGSLADGRLFVFLELSDDALESLVLDLQASLPEIRKQQ